MSDDFFEDLAAIGIGAGAGTYAFRRNLAQATSSPIQRQNKELLMGRLRKLDANQSLSSSVRRARIATGAEFLDNVSARLATAKLGPGVIKEEWLRAMETTLPDVATFNRFPIKGDPLASVRLNLNKNTSIYTMDVFDKFRFNVESILQTGSPYAFSSGGDFAGFGLLQSSRPGIPNQLSGLVDAMGGRGSFELERLGEAGQGFWTAHRRRGKGLEKLFTIPEAFSAPGSAHRGLVRTGDNLQNLYAPGLFQMVDDGGAPIGDMMTFGQYKINRLTQVAEDVTSGKIGGTMESALRAASEELDKMMPFVGPNLGGGELTPEAIYRSSQFTAIGPSGNPLVGKAKREFVEKYSESMGFVPTGGSARFSLGSADEIFGGFTSEIDYARKPWQRIRGFTPTDEAIEAIEASRYGGSDFSFVDSPLAGEATGGRPSAARLKTLYLDDGQIERLREMGLPVGDGELLLNKNMSSQLQVSRLRRLRVSEVNQEIADKVKGQIGPGSKRGVFDQAIDLDKNSLIGRTLEGVLESSGPQTSIVGAAPVQVQTMSGGQSTAVDLILKDTVSASGSSKVFGGLKGQARRLDFSKLDDKALKVMGVSIDELEDVGAIARAADIKATKDPAKALMQQFSGVMTYAQEMAGTDKTFMEMFGYNDKLADPLRMGVAEDILSSATQSLASINKMEGGFAAKSGAIREIAEDLGLDTPQMERIFGQEGTRMGIAALSPGDPKVLTGAGKRGTFEPRLLSLLEGGSFGEYGEGVAEDFLTRLYHGRPDVTAMNQELRKTLRSIAGDYTPGEGATIFNLGDLQGERGDFLRGKGGFLETGISDMPYIHMPGYNQAPAMRPRLMGGDKAIQGSPVASVFKNIERDIGLAASGNISTEDFINRFEQDKTGYISELWRAYAPGGKGQGAVGRGKLLGSRFLTAVSDIGDAPSGFLGASEALVTEGVPEGRVIGLPGEMAEEMFSEMEQLYDKSSVKEMRKLFNDGKAIGGVVSRHPFIGPFSAQPVMMIKAATDEPVMLVPEKIKKVTVMGKEFDITTGILEGLALDKDADIPMAIALNPDMERKVRKGLGTRGSKLQTDLAAYESHSMRSQMLKLSSSPGAEMSTAQRAAAAVGKLGITDEQVGQVSTSLTKARAAIVNSTLPRADITRGLSLLEWMEQQPIAGKHLDPSQVLEGIFEQQMFAIRKGSSGHHELLTSVVEEMLNHNDPTQKKINKALLGKGLMVDGKNVAGFELQKTSQQIATAMEEFMRKGSHEQQSLIQDFLSPSGSKTMKRNMLSRALDATSMKPQGGTRSFQRKALAKVNEAYGAVGAKVRPFAKPGLIGLAAAGTAAFLMSGSPSDMDPPKYGSMDTSPPVRNTNQSRDEVRAPSSPGLGDPSIGSQISNSTYMLDEVGAEQRKAIRAKISANNITPQQRMALSSRLSANYRGGLNMNVRDSRRSLNNTTVTDILDQ